MPIYKVKAGHKFGLLPNGATVELTEQEAASHLRHLEQVPDLQVSSGITVAPQDQLLSEEGGPNYASLTVAQLREELHSRELDTVGTKAELVARLEKFDKETG